MLLIILFGLIAILSSGSGQCDFKKQGVRVNWDKLSGDRTWYYVMQSPNSPTSNLTCIKQKFENLQERSTPFEFNAIDISTQSPLEVYGQAVVENSTKIREYFYYHDILNGVANPIAVDYDRYYIFQYCYNHTKQLAVYVAYRSWNPDKETMNLVKKKFKENKIDYCQMEDFLLENCN